MAEVIQYLTLIILTGLLLANLAKFYRTSSVVPLLFGGLILRYFGILKPDLVPDLEPVIILTLSLVLFYAGLTLDVENTLRYWKVIALLAIAGVFLFTIIMGTFVQLSPLGLTLASAILLGAVLAPTDPAALFSVLESGHKVKRKLKTILVGESCFNDAAAFVTVFIVLVPLLFAKKAVSPSLIVLGFLWSIAGGVLTGIFVTYILGKMIEHLRDPTTTKVLVITSAILSYILAESIYASGVIASLTAGILYGNLRLIKLTPLPKRNLIDLMEDINFLVEIFIFILLGSIIDPAKLPNVIVPGFVIAFLALIFARPIVTFLLSSIDRRIKWEEKLFLSLAGTKGVTSGALALALATLGIPYADEILVLTFITILLTVTFQAVVLPILIKKFRLEEKEDVLRELILKRNALREALLDLVDRYSNGEVPENIYRELSSEIKDKISEIEREIGEITESRRLTIERLKARINILNKQIEYFDNEYNEGRISTDLYEKIVSELRNEKEELEVQLKEFQRTK